MEESILNNSATLAKPAEGLLARLKRERNPQDGIKPYQLPPDEFRAHIAACVEAAREPWDRGAHRLNIEPGDDDDAPAEPVPVPRRQRKRSLTKVCEAARRAGADRVIVDDSVVIVLSPAAAVAAESNGNEFDEWMAKHAH